MNEYNIYLKNLNTIGKNDSSYKSSPQIELMSIFTVNSSFPLIKREDDFTNYVGTGFSGNGKRRRYAGKYTYKL